MVIFGNFRLTLLVLLEVIPGVLCRYDYNVGGMVAAATAGFFFLLVIAVMIMITIFWRDWYFKRQTLRGIPRIARPMHGRRFLNSKKRKSPSVVMSTPRTDRKLIMRMHNGNMPGSRNTTLNRERERADRWITNLPGPDAFEEKGGTMNFEAEEEFVIAADILPDENNLRRTQQLGATQPARTQQLGTTQPHLTQQLSTTQPPRTQQLGATQPPIQISTATYQNQRTAALSSTQRPATDSGMRTTYVPYAKTSAKSPSPQQVRQTTAGVVRHAPIHVRASNISQTTRATSGQEDIFISPMIPSSSQNAGGAGFSGADVVIFDSDDEAGFIATHQEDDVLF